MRNHKKKPYKKYTDKDKFLYYSARCCHDTINDIMGNPPTATPKQVARAEKWLAENPPEK